MMNQAADLPVFLSRQHLYLFLTIRSFSIYYIPLHDQTVRFVEAEIKRVFVLT